MNTVLCKTQEIWKPIPGYEGLYEASSLGRVHSVEGRVLPHRKTGTAVRHERILSQTVSKRKGSDKYDARVNLSKEGHDKRFLVARLIAMAFCHGYQEGLTVNHINGDTLDNRPENLEWVTRATNIKLGHQDHMYPNKMKPVFLIDEDENKMLFYSRAQAARYLGRSAVYILDCLRKQKTATSTISGRSYRVA